MVRGVFKQVVVIRPEDNSFFEQAILIVKPHAAKNKLKEADILAEANRVINERIQRYCAEGKKRRLFRWF